MEAVRHFEKIICQNIWTEIVQYLWNDLCELTQAFGKIDFGGIR